MESRSDQVFPSARASANSLQACLTLCNPVGSSVRWILQARILEWVAMLSPPGDLPDPGIEPSSPVVSVLQADSLPLSHQASPFTVYLHLYLHLFTYQCL